MNTAREEIYINYRGEEIKITPQANETDSFFIVHLEENKLELRIDYIEDHPCWTENGVVTETSEALGRLIEEYDGR